MSDSNLDTAWKIRLEAEIVKLSEQLAAAELRAGEYEKALELFMDRGLDWDMMHTRNANELLQNCRGKASEVLAKHRRGGEGG